VNWKDEIERRRAARWEADERARRRLALKPRFGEHRDVLNDGWLGNAIFGVVAAVFLFVLARWAGWSF
jgi:hypothetical protein